VKPESELLHEIEEQTEREIERLREELDRFEADRKTRTKREIEELGKKIDEYTDARLHKMEQAATASIAAECHRIELETRRRFFERIIEAAVSRIHALIGSDGYDSILEDWVVEAAVGLAADEAVVTTSPHEQEICKRVLPEAEKRVRKLLGHTVSLYLSTATTHQGVILTAKSGRTAYNNQVRTRIMRRETEIRRIIYDELSRAVTGKEPDGAEGER
jgi:vacuolar-type H+-ATPase subunit E/Vma4